MSKPVALRLNVDGGSRGNPGPAGCGVVLADADGETLLERGYFLGAITNNVAEYHGLLKGLELAAQFNPQRLEIFSDSELMVRQITGEYRVKSPDLMPLFAQAQLGLLKFDSWQIRHVPRAQNAAADRMANLAMDAKADVDDGGDSLSPLSLKGEGAGVSGSDAPRAKGGSPATARQGGKAARGIHLADADEAADNTDAAPGVRVRVTLSCDPRVCPVTMMKDATFLCDSVTPAGLCLFAASAVIPAAAGLLREAAASPGMAMPKLKVTCPRPGCDAVFELSITADV